MRMLVLRLMVLLYPWRDESVHTAYQSGWGRGYNQGTGIEIGWGDNLWGTLET